MLLQILSFFDISIRICLIIIPINSAITFLISEWMKNKIKQGFDEKIEDYKATLKRELDRQLEDYKFMIKTKEQATKVAELFSIIYSSPSFKERNKIIWELSLWLPEEILKDIGQQLVDPTKGKDVKEILMDVRKHLLNTQPTSLKAEDIVHYK